MSARTSSATKDRSIFRSAACSSVGFHNNVDKDDDDDKHDGRVDEYDR